MSLLLKSRRLANGLVGFARQAKVAVGRQKIFSRRWRHPFAINPVFIRSCALAPQSGFPMISTTNVKETLYQKSVMQIYFDIKHKGYIFRKDLNDAWRTLKSSTPDTVKQTALLITTCGHNLPLETISGRLELVKEIWDSLDDLGIEKIIDHYNALLGVYIELEHKFSPIDFLSNLEKEGLVPNQETYSKLLHALSIQGNISQCQHFLKHMKVHSVSINDRVFNSLILGYSLEGDFISARGILDLMKEQEFTLSSKVYVSLALGYAKQGDIEKVKEVVDEARVEMSNFSSTDFLELAYTFAVNGYSEHFSAILDMIPYEKSFPVISTKVVHRLLHKNLNEEALAVFAIRDKLESISMMSEPVQMFLNHYVKFRGPHEILNVIELFRQKGWSPISLAYCLKETLIHKDIVHCLNFIHTMKIRNYPVRIHYFYPIFVKARSSGNETVLEIIQYVTSKYNLTFGRESVRALHKFYDFVPGAELEDLEKLAHVGVDRKLAAWKILDILLNNQDIDAAISFVSTHGIANAAVLLPFSMAYSFRKRDDPENFVHILYVLIHNLKVNKMAQQPTAEVNPVEFEQFLIQMGKCCSEPFNIAVLEEMLKRKIPLSASAAAFLSKCFSCPQVTALASELTSPDLKLEFDEALLKQLSETDGGEKMQDLLLKENAKNEWSQLYVALESKMDLPAVVKIFENLTQKTGLSIKMKHKKVVARLFRLASRKGDVVNAEKVYRVGVEKDLIKAENFGPCVIAYLVRDDLDGALRRFNEGLRATKKCGPFNILIKEIMERNNILVLEDLKVSVTKVCGKNFAATKFLTELAKLGYDLEARKVLQSDVKILKPLFDEICLEQFTEGNFTYFETLEKASRKVANKNMVFLYYPLLKLYTLSGNLGKLLNLYVELVRDNAVKGVLGLFLDFLNDWKGDVPEELENALLCVREHMNKKEVVGDRKTFSYKEEQNNFLKDIQPNFAGKDEFMSNFNNENDLLQCFCLLHAGKLDEYFKILEGKIAADGPAKASNYFFHNSMLPLMKENRLREYENLVRMCDCSDVWKKYLKVCISLRYIRGIRVAIKALDPVEVKSCFREIGFRQCLAFIDDAECNLQLRKYMAVIYVEVINALIEKNHLKMAKKYYERAQKFGIDVFVDSFPRLFENLK